MYAHYDDVAVNIAGGENYTTQHKSNLLYWIRLVAWFFIRWIMQK